MTQIAAATDGAPVPSPVLPIAAPPDDAGQSPGITASAVLATDQPLAPLIEGTRAPRYHALFEGIRDTLTPGDVLEQIWVQDIADLAWEVVRLRALKAEIMRIFAYQGMERVLEPLVDQSRENPKGLAKGWARRNERVLPIVESALAKAGLGEDAVAAATLVARIGEIERVDRMTAAAETRRNAALRELDRHRAQLARRLRDALDAAQAQELSVWVRP